MEPEQYPHPTLPYTLSLLERTLHPASIHQAEKQINKQQNNTQFISNLLQLASNQQISIQSRQACLVALKNAVNNYYNKLDRLQIVRPVNVVDNQSEMQGERDQQSHYKQIISMIRKNIVGIAYSSERIIGLLASKILVVMVRKGKIKDLSYLGINNNNLKNIHEQYTYLVILSDICEYYSNSITQSKTHHTILNKHYQPILQILKTSITDLTNNTNSSQNKLNLQFITKILQIIVYSTTPHFCDGLVQYVEEILLVVLAVLGIGQKVWGNQGQFQHDILLLMELSLSVITAVYRWAHTNSISDKPTANICSRLLDCQYIKHVITIINHILQQTQPAPTNNPPQLYSIICKCLHSLAIASKQIKQLIVANSINILIRLLSLYTLSDDGDGEPDVMMRSQVEESRAGLMELLGLLMLDGVGQLIVNQIVDAAKISSNNTASSVQLPLYIMSQHHRHFVQHIPTVIQNPIAAIINNCNPSNLQLLLKVRSCQFMSTVLSTTPKQYIGQLYHIMMLDITRLFQQIHRYIQTSDNSYAHLLDNYAETANIQLQMLVIMGNMIKIHSTTDYGVKYIQMMGRILAVMEISSKETNNIVLSQFNEIMNKYYQLTQCTPHVQLPALTSITLPSILPIYLNQLTNLTENQHNQPQLQQQQLGLTTKPVHQLCCHIIHHLLQQNNQHFLSTNMDDCAKYSVGLLMELLDEDLINVMGCMLEKVSTCCVGVVENYLAVVGQCLYTFARAVDIGVQQTWMSRLHNIFQLCCKIICKLNPNNQQIAQNPAIQQYDDQFVFDGDCELLGQGQTNKIVKIQQEAEIEVGIDSISDSIRWVLMSAMGNIVGILSTINKDYIKHHQHQLQQLYLSILIEPSSISSATIRQQKVATNILRMMVIQQILTHDTLILLLNKLIPSMSSDSMNHLLICSIVATNRTIIQHIDIAQFMKAIADSQGWKEDGACWIAECACVVLSYLFNKSMGGQHEEQMQKIGNKLMSYLHPQQQTTTNKQEHPLVLSLAHTPILNMQQKSLKHKDQSHEITVIQIQQIVDRTQHRSYLETEYGNIISILTK